MLFLFINCTAIEIFTGWATARNLYLAEHFNTPIDFTPLVTLIGVVLGEVLSFGIYALKSAKENTAGGIVYDSALKQSIETPKEEVVNDENEVG